MSQVQSDTSRKSAEDLQRGKEIRLKTNVKNPQPVSCWRLQAHSVKS